MGLASGVVFANLVNSSGNAAGKQKPVIQQKSSLLINKQTVHLLSTYEWPIME